MKNWLLERSHTIYFAFMLVVSVALAVVYLFAKDSSPELHWKTVVFLVGETFFNLCFAMIPLNIWSTHRLLKAYRSKNSFASQMPVHFMGVLRKTDQSIIASLYASGIVLIMLVLVCGSGILIRMQGNSILS